MTPKWDTFYWDPVFSGHYGTAVHIAGKAVTAFHQCLPQRCQIQSKNKTLILGNAIPFLDLKLKQGGVVF